MIKIEFKDPKAAKGKYLRLIYTNSVKRLKILHTSLMHLSTGPTSRDPGFDSYQAVTKKIINSLLPKKKKYADADFQSKAAYDKTANDFFTNEKAKLNTINFKGLIDLVDFLLAGKPIPNLAKLMICPADRLWSFNDAILKQFKITHKLETEALGLGFDWGLHTEIVDEIKGFFRKEELVIFCPYCNTLEADYSETQAGDVGSYHYLDHFFDKARFPLLAFSMYNLVPCDANCNGTLNKGRIEFTDDYHLNPYISGMDRSRMIFQPVVKQVGQIPDEILLYVQPPQSARRYQQLIGDYPGIDESCKHGNINVFSLQLRYNRPFVRDHAWTVLDKLEDHFQSRDTLKRFQVKMKQTKLTLPLYELWYKREFNAEFLPEKFKNGRFSKLVRDIHDNLLEKDTTDENDDIKKFMTNNPA